MTAFWTKVEDSDLNQGDYLPDCVVPILDDDFDLDLDLADEDDETDPITQRVEFEVFDLITVTQTCDLVTKATAQTVALCPIYELSDYEDVNTKLRKTGAWENVRKGRYAGLHLLGSLTNPSDNRSSLVVDFHDVYSLPHEYLRRHVEKLGERHRLQSPFLEHFSQAFAKHFMRVGLPSEIPRFRG